MDAPTSQSSLFRHVSAENAVVYRTVMEAFAAAKRQFRMHLRPDEVRVEAPWRSATPAPEAVQSALVQLVEWGNLQAQPDTARVSTIEDFYRARFLYSLTSGGEAAEAGLETFARALRRRGELQSVALEDILGHLGALAALAAESPMDAAKVHQSLRALVEVFKSLAENSQAFMAGLARSIELQQAELEPLMAYKARLVDYLERFIGDLVTLSPRIARRIAGLQPMAEAMLDAAADREARDAAPEGGMTQDGMRLERLEPWRERWNGLVGWFIGTEDRQAQSDLLRARARSAIPRLLAAVSALNDRRSGRSDRSADYRVLARWFAQARGEDEAHRLARAAFALNPARHLALLAEGRTAAASTPWADGPSVHIVPRLRERGQLKLRGAPPRVRDKSEERRLLSERVAAENVQVQAAHDRFCTGVPARLSELGSLDRHEFRFFLSLLGEALAAQRRPDQSVERFTSDGLLKVRLEPLPFAPPALLETELGRFEGRDHSITITPIAEAA